MRRGEHLCDFIGGKELHALFGGNDEPEERMQELAPRAFDTAEDKEALIALARSTQQRSQRFEFSPCESAWAGAG